MTIAGLYRSGFRATHLLSGFMLPQRGGLAAAGNPELIYAVALQPDQVVVIFSNRMNQTEIAEASNYTITPDAGSDARVVDSVVVVGPHIAELTLDGDLTAGTFNYRVTVDDAVRDENGFPMNDGALFFDLSGPFQDVQILSVVAIDSTHVRVTFSQAVLNNPALACVDSYAIVPQDPGEATVTILGVAAEGTPATSVLLTTTEHHNLEDYDLTLHRLEVA